MKKLLFLIILISFYLNPILASNSADNEPELDAVNITASGIGTIEKNIKDARDKAIQDALRLAVEQARGVMVKVETEVNNYALVKDEVLSHTEGFVKSYQIISEEEKRDVKIYKVTIVALVQISDPELKKPPLQFNTKIYGNKEQSIIQELIALSKHTNQIALNIKDRNFDELAKHKSDMLLNRYHTLIQVINAIEPPPRFQKQHHALIKAIQLKTHATSIFVQSVKLNKNPEKLRSAFNMNNEANKILKHLRDQKR
ncbi:MAG: hypothetical protein HY934_01430 [Candidatus Firestonebacteria bacterium]|nr:hypothetical protein [Candidatus Firestonebacteria bacterium]